MTVLADVSVSKDGSYLTLNVGDRAVRFHAVWLRDNTLDANSVSSQNGQRLLTLLQQPSGVTLASARVTELASGEPVVAESGVFNSVVVQVCFEDIDTVYQFPVSWLLEHVYDRPVSANPGWTSAAIERWGGNLQNRIPVIDFADACEDRKALGDWLAAIERYGFAKMCGLPDDPDSLLEVTRLFGFVRETNYGKTFDVRVEARPVNLAYTGQGLQAHTDNPYRRPAPTMQILACIENTVDGGESIVVDGFNAAGILLREQPEHFNLLHSYCARFQFSGGDDTCLSSRAPMIELAPDGELVAVRFNNRSAAPFQDIPFDKMRSYYDAYRNFSEIIERSENEVEFRLQSNELFIVDNTRVLHSRRAFSGAGKRWLRGCYPDKDGMLSTLAVIQGQHRS